MGERGGGSAPFFQNIDDGPIKWLLLGKGKEKTMLAAEPRTALRTSGYFIPLSFDARPLDLYMPCIGSGVVGVCVFENNAGRTKNLTKNLRLFYAPPPGPDGRPRLVHTYIGNRVV